LEGVVKNMKHKDLSWMSNHKILQQNIW